MKSVMTQLADMADIALDAVRTLLTSPDTPPSVRLRAAIFVLNANSSPQEHKPQPKHVPPPPRPQPESLPTPEPESFSPPASPKPRQPYIAPLRPGRNEPCTCGSGIKHKKCCLGKPAPPLGAAA